MQHPDQTSPMTVGPEAFLEEPKALSASAQAVLVDALRAAEFAMDWAHPHLEADPVTQERGINEAHKSALSEVRAALVKAGAA